ncbi:MAG TPA: LuxR C-terminal-related transcriptional regulator, partial [Thermodesulfobacteriota bacterium]|nr:LuxR C-terminal-related transcriptional regulator [Thermodesulfobacteriota bacterium]
SPDEMRELTIADLEATSHSQEGAGGSPRDLCGGSDRLEMEFVCKDHRKITVEISISSVEQDGQELCFAFFHDITERKKTQQELLKRERKLKIQHRNLEEVNTALRVLLKKREEDKSNLEENVLSNIKGLVFPYLEKLKQARLDRNQMMYVSILESHLNDIVSPFAQKLSSQYFGFTPQEIRIASMVKEGLTNKEIAEILGTCVRTIAFHRENIRKTLGLKNKKANLETHLMSL